MGHHLVPLINPINYAFVLFFFPFLEGFLPMPLATSPLSFLSA